MEKEKERAMEEMKEEMEEDGKSKSE